MKPYRGIKPYLILCIVFFLSSLSFAEISIQVDALKGNKPISPYLYGRNVYSGNGGELLYDSDTLTESEQNAVFLFREAGFKMLRLSQGNNGTKYNWRKKLSSHPDFYNNVYTHDWDRTARKLQQFLPGVAGLYAFQLTGFAAQTESANFADWDYYKSHNDTWAPRDLDLAGGGQVDDFGNLITSGDYKLYLTEWPADSSIGIISHWRDALKFDMSLFTYWSMDNEMEIWPGTHSDLPYSYPEGDDTAAERMIQNYVQVALSAKKIFPSIKLTGPVAANEWTWCNIRYDNGKTAVVTAKDKKYCWIEYFIKRIAEEEKKSGVKLLDVFDIHWYPSEKDYESQINWHRVFFDTTYNYPGANGIKRANETCKWDESITKEYIFKRIGDWLSKYMGENHGITFALTETDFPESMDAMTRAIVYASFLGTFADNGVEIFTPWTWREGMYEAAHLFARYAQKVRIEATSSNDSLVSSYASLGSDSLTIILVNRAEKSSEPITLSIQNFDAKEKAELLTLSNLSKETFVSHSQNAIKRSNVSLSKNSATFSLPEKSISALILSNAHSSPIKKITPKENPRIFYSSKTWYLDNSSGIATSAIFFDALGKRAHALTPSKGVIPLTDLSSGTYLVKIETPSGSSVFRFTVK